MVYYEHDKLDENKLEELFIHAEDKKITMKNGEIIEAEAVCVYKPQKRFNVRTTAGEELEFYADEVKKITSL